MTDKRSTIWRLNRVDVSSDIQLSQLMSNISFMIQFNANTSNVRTRKRCPIIA